MPDVVLPFEYVKWNKIVDRAEKRGRFTKDEVDQSQNWSCCALGERDAACEGLVGKGWEDGKDEYIEQNFSKKAFELGCEFYNRAIYKDDFKLARQILKKFEKMPKEEFYQ